MNIRLSLLPLLVMAVPAWSASVPYLEDFASYAPGDTPVTNFTEIDPPLWTITAAHAYQSAASVSSSTTTAAGQNLLSIISLPSLAAAAFSISTIFTIDTFTVVGDARNTGTIGLTARAADDTSTGTNRYKVSYFLDDDDSGHATGKLFLTEINSGTGDSLHALSAGFLAVVPGEIYSYTLTGTPSGSSLDLVATLSKSGGGSVSVSATDSSDVLGGSFFGYQNSINAIGTGGGVTLDADFDNFTATPEPNSAALLALGAAGFLSSRWRKYEQLLEPRL